MAQERSNVAISVLSAVDSGALRSVSAAGQLAGAAGVGVGGKVGGIMASMYDYSQNSTIGRISGKFYTIQRRRERFLFFAEKYHSKLRRNDRQLFDMFGYAVHQHLTPNMNARPNWTYCKTIGCIVHGNMPASAARDIESMFDSGVRFWKIIIILETIH